MRRWISFRGYSSNFLDCFDLEFPVGDTETQNRDLVDWLIISESGIAGAPSDHFCLTFWNQWHWQPPFTGVQRWGGQTASKDPLFNSFRNYFRLFSWVQHHECPPGQPVWKSARYPLLYKWLSNLTSHLFAKVSFSPHLQCGHSRKL